MPVLILTAHGQEVDKVRGFRLGADDYVTKPFGLLETDGPQRHDGGAHPDGVRFAHRSGERCGTVASRVELLQEVWGHSSAVLTRTVDTHIAELRRKLEADPSDPEHILTVRKAGYRLQP